MDERERLLEKLRRIEALHAGATTDGERNAAASARERITARIAAVGDAAEEYHFSLQNPWSHKLFVALARRYGLRPYRYPRQRHTTVMLRVPKSVVDTLWPEFRALDEAMAKHLNEVAEHAIAEAISDDISDVEVIKGHFTGPSEVGG